MISSALSAFGGSRSTRICGWKALANSVPPWGLLAAPVTLAVKDPEHTPYCVGSSDHMLSRVLGEEWPHKDVLETMP